MEILSFSVSLYGVSYMVKTRIFQVRQQS